jgi:hypothetical protein
VPANEAANTIAVSTAIKAALQAANKTAQSAAICASESTADTSADKVANKATIHPTIGSAFVFAKWTTKSQSVNNAEYGSFQPAFARTLSGAVITTIRTTILATRGIPIDSADRCPVGPTVRQSDFVTIRIPVK